MPQSKPQEPNRAARRAAKRNARTPRKDAQPERMLMATPSQRPPAMDDDTDDTTDDPTATEEPADFEASYRRFEAEARAVDARDVVTFTSNALVAFQNIRRGTRNVLAERATLEADPDAPRVDWSALPLAVRAGEALVYAARQATLSTRGTTPRTASRKLLKEMFAARDMLRSNALGAVKAGVLTDEAAVDVHRAALGRGALNGAQDCIDLAAVFRRNAAVLAGRTPVTEAQVARAAELGAQVLHAMAPRGVEKQRSDDSEAARAADMRDRMAIVAANRYDLVARVAGWRWGFAMGEHVPTLRARAAAPRKKPAGGATPVTPPNDG